MSPVPRTPPAAGPARLARLRPRGRAAVIGVPYLWRLVFFMLPVAVVLQISLAPAAVALGIFDQVLRAFLIGAP